MFTMPPMRETTSKEKVLKKIRKALIHKTPPKNMAVDFEKAVFPALEEDEAVHFARELLALGGEFAFCENQLDFAENLIALVQHLQTDQIFCFEPAIQALFDKVEFPYRKDAGKIHDMEVGVTGCEALIARSGTIMVSSAQTRGRVMTAYPPVHVVIAFTSQLVTDLKEGFDLVKARHGGKLPSMLSSITGPSRTADIEKTLVMGAHGPKALYVFLVQDEA